MIENLTRPRLESILEQISRRKVGIIGDFVLDGYWYADMTRAQLSREAPLFNRPIVAETYSPGGAANVAWNLADLGVGEVHAISILGADWRGSLLRDIFHRLGVHTEALLERPDWKTPFYGKVILTGWDTRQEDARLDMINPQPPSAAHEAALIEALRQSVPGLDALIIADYLPQGLITRGVQAALLELAERYPQVSFLADSRERIADFQSMVIKPNVVEASHLFFPGKPGLGASEGKPGLGASEGKPPAEVTAQALEKAALALNARTKKPVYITLGEKGCVLCQASEAIHLPAVQVDPPLDTVGAGDTFLASLGAALAAGATPLEAGCLANLAAGVTIQKIGMTGTASPQEIRTLYQKQTQP